MAAQETCAALSTSVVGGIKSRQPSVSVTELREGKAPFVVVFFFTALLSEAQPTTILIVKQIHVSEILLAVNPPSFIDVCAFTHRCSNTGMITSLSNSCCSILSVKCLYRQQLFFFFLPFHLTYFSLPPVWWSKCKRTFQLGFPQYQSFPMNMTNL